MAINKKDEFSKKGSRHFFELLKGELDDIPTAVFVNIKSKQKNLASDADKLSNLISNILKNPGAIAQVPGVAKLYNELIESSGFSPVDFSAITTPQPVMNNQPQPTQHPTAPLPA